MDLNELKRYMDFYKQNGLGGVDYSAHNGFNPTPFNPNADAERWAMNAMGGDRPAPMPDYFGGGGGAPGYAPAQYVQPKSFAPTSMPGASSLGGQITNYLSRFLNRGR